MPKLHLTVLSLRYSSWSMRPWLALTQAGASFDTSTVALAEMHVAATAGSPNQATTQPTSLSDRRAMGSVHGLFPVLRVDGTPIHESLAICEYVADAFPAAGLWPADPVLRAQARAISCEMVSGFGGMRSELSCHPFARVPNFVPGAAAQKDINRVLEIWSACLEQSGGPFLFGSFTIADAMYYPVLTRLRTYGVPVEGKLADYAQALEQQPAVQQLVAVAKNAPRIPIYDSFVRNLGGDPDGALPTS